MAYPDDLDTLTNPLAADPRVGHAALHGTVNDAIEAIEAKLGTGDSTASNESVMYGTAAGVSEWRAASQVVYAGVLNAFGDGLYKETVTLSSAQMLALATTPVTIVDAPGAGKWVRVHATSEYLAYGTTPYATVDDDPALFYDTAAGTRIVYFQTNPATASSVGYGVPIGSGPVAASGAVNKPVVAALNGTDLTDGDSAITIAVWYSIEDVP